MPRLLTLMDAQAAGHITHIRGNDSNVGMTIEVQNDSDEAITIRSEVGTVIGSKDPHTQKMVITRGNSWTVPPRSKGNITVDALCLEAHKVPPSSRAGEADHNIDGMTDNADVRRLLNTLQEVEAKISANITAEDTQAGTFSHTLESPNLIALASAASNTKVKGQNAFLSRIYDNVIQMPVWEITDRLGITEYAKVVGMDKRSATHEELRATVEVLSDMAKIAKILLDEAELSNKQTIQPAEDELEILYIEHDLLSSDIGRLRREALAPGADKESVQIKINEKEILLGEKEREIGVYPHKDALIEELLRLPITNNLAGRTALLGGVRAENLQRDENMQRHDLDLIVTQLARLGRDEHGNVLLVTLIDNALPYAEGFEPHANLTNLKGGFTAL
jgi:hypothetical protein